MASEAAQNFLQPLSSWMSQIYEAIQQAGDSISASLLNLSGVGRKPEERTQDLENNGGVYEDYSEGSSDERDLDLWDEDYFYPREDSYIGGPDLASQNLPHGSDVGSQRQNQLKNPSTVAEQCAESSRSLAANGSCWMGEDLQPGDRLPPIAEEEDLDGLSQLSYQDNISCHEDDHGSVDSRTTTRNKGTGQHKGPRMEPRTGDGVSQSHREGRLEMETTFANQGLGVNDATDSSSAWSPEEHNGVNSAPAHHGAHEPICKCGDLDVIFTYKPSSQKLTATVLEARDIPDKDRSGVNTWQVHAVLMPGKKQRGKTSVQRGPIPIFQDKITFSKLEPQELSSHAVRFRLYAVHKVRGEKMMGEQLFYLSGIRQEGELKVTLLLEPRSNLSVSLVKDTWSP
uniref:C2 domain-containing protein n=1 Tax=Catharus ustulatus TaxID=91951 RepID=A0A8C3V2P7_CATUS